MNEWEYGEILPGVRCPACEGELVMTEHGAYCDWDGAYVAVLDSPAIVDNDLDDDEGEPW